MRFSELVTVYNVKFFCYSMGLVCVGIRRCQWQLWLVFHHCTTNRLAKPRKKLARATVGGTQVARPKPARPALRRLAGLKVASSPRPAPQGGRLGSKADSSPGLPFSPACLEAAARPQAGQLARLAFRRAAGLPKRRRPARQACLVCPGEVQGWAG